MSTAFDIVKGVYEILGRPSQQELPYQHVINALNRKMRGRLLDLQLSEKNYLARLRTIQPTSRNYQINLDDFSVPIRVEARSVNSQSDDEWSEWSVEDFGNWDAFNGRGRSVAFYGTNPVRMVFSWDVTNLTFRLLYETGGVTISELTDDIMLGDIFDPLLTGEVALECVAMMDGKPDAWVNRKRSYLLGDLAMQQERFSQWVKRSYGQGVYYKEGFGENLPTGLRYDGIQLISD